MSYPQEHHHHDDVLGGKDHELTLSTAAIFGIFFGLVILCGIFFGFGYSLGGHKSGNNLPSDSASSATPANFGAFKPAPGQPTNAHVDAAPSPAPAEPKQAPAEDQPAAEDATPAAAPVVRVAPPVATPAPRPVAALPATPTPAATPAPSFLVQVAAININHPEDANLLMNALKAKGYAISAHPGPDNFIHLLIGPFNNRPAAEAMRQRLLSDGYTAYIK